MKLLVMGIGYIGSALLKHLQKTPNYEIYATTTQASKVDELKTLASHVIVLDPHNHEFQQIFDVCDGMIILIAPKNRQNYEETYLNTAKMISSLIKKRRKPLYLIYTSSTSVYEGSKQEWVAEDSLLNPSSENIKILLEAENLYLSYPDSCILRLGGIFGPGRELTKRARSFSGKEIAGTGDEQTNHIHRDDCVAAIEFCLKHRLTGKYNLVNQDHPTRKELYSTHCHSLQIPLPIWNPELSNKKGYKVSNQKISNSGFICNHGVDLF